jgi:hypothetical protein
VVGVRKHLRRVRLEHQALPGTAGTYVHHRVVAFWMLHPPAVTPLHFLGCTRQSETDSTPLRLHLPQTCRQAALQATGEGHGTRNSHAHDTAIRSLKAIDIREDPSHVCWFRHASPPTREGLYEPVSAHCYGRRYRRLLQALCPPLPAAPVASRTTPTVSCHHTDTAGEPAHLGLLPLEPLPQCQQDSPKNVVAPLRPYCPRLGRSTRWVAGLPRALVPLCCSLYPRQGRGTLLAVGDHHLLATSRGFADVAPYGKPSMGWLCYSACLRPRW